MRENQSFGKELKEIRRSEAAAVEMSLFHIHAARISTWESECKECLLCKYWKPGVGARTKWGGGEYGFRWGGLM